MAFLLVSSILWPLNMAFSRVFRGAKIPQKVKLTMLVGGLWGPVEVFETLYCAPPKKVGGCVPRWELSFSGCGYFWYQVCEPTRKFFKQHLVGRSRLLPQRLVRLRGAVENHLRDVESLRKIGAWIHEKFLLRRYHEVLEDSGNGVDTFAYRHTMQKTRNRKHTTRPIHAA